MLQRDFIVTQRLAGLYFPCIASAPILVDVVPSATPCALGCLSARGPGPPVRRMPAVDSSDRTVIVLSVFGRAKENPRRAFGAWRGFFLPLGPVGPWCLLLGDTHQAVSTFAIRAIPQMLGGRPARTEACDQAFDLRHRDGPRIGSHRGRSRLSDELLRRPEGLLDSL